MDMISLQSIARAVDGQVCSGQVRCAYPGKDRRKIGGLAITPSSSSRVGFMVNSFYGDVSPAEAFEYVKSRLGSLSPLNTYSRKESPLAPASNVPPDRTARAMRLWCYGVDPTGTQAERYLQRERKLPLPDQAAWSVLRWNARISALLGLFRDLRTDEPRAVTCIRLNSDGLKQGRFFYGPVGGAAVKLAQPHAGVLAVAEGIETALAAMQMGIGPCWALGSCGAVRAFPVLPGISTLILCREQDEHSPPAAEACARRWSGAGRGVLIAEPGTGKDMNDAVMADASYLIAPYHGGRK